ncbi:hypothetical protein E2C01_022374 [Portunus trituberculatus]|uniref:Uncharacterized protein n=1 Tax=Portunus trituberculatus TaxID=210409 RepID=A0A5B7E8R5_PORTR|nr:hypothetical protein [Portunus trituberculatus]
MQHPRQLLRKVCVAVHQQPLSSIRVLFLLVLLTLSPTKCLTNHFTSKISISNSGQVYFYVATPETPLSWVLVNLPSRLSVVSIGSSSASMLSVSSSCGGRSGGFS